MPSSLVLFASNTKQDESSALCSEGTTYWIQLNAGWFRSSSRTELAIYPSEIRSPYFRWMHSRYYRIYGADRHRDADPDRDGVGNALELVLNTYPEGKEANLEAAHFLEEVSGQMNLVWTEVWANYTELYINLPLELVAESAPNPGGPWTASPPVNYRRGFLDFQRTPLPQGGDGGYARLRRHNPNLVISD